MITSILIDNKDSWFIPYGLILVNKLKEKGMCANLYTSIKDCPPCDICFMLSCIKIVPLSFLKINSHNIVVHASDLPKGKGFTPIKWQILEGKNVIPLTLFEAVEQCDAGPFYFKDSITLEGHELLDEIQNIMAHKIIDMCVKYACNVDIYKPIIQVGESTMYRKFTNEDDYIDVRSSIVEIFDRRRIADSKRFPVKFKYRNFEYSITVNKI